MIPIDHGTLHSMGFAKPGAQITQRAGAWLQTQAIAAGQPSIVLRCL